MTKTRYYRQATLDKAMDCADVTNALETYFAKWNRGRKFMLAAHSQGSAILRLVMENYFMQDDGHKAFLKQLVASYQIGFGLDKKTEETIREKAGVPFVTNATDTGVYIMWNTQGGSVTPGTTAALWPSNAVPSANPLTWTHALPLSGLKKAETATVPDVVGASWKVEVKGEGQGQEWNEAVLSPVDGCYYVLGSGRLDDDRDRSRDRDGELRPKYGCGRRVQGQAAQERQDHGNTRMERSLNFPRIKRLIFQFTQRAIGRPTSRICHE